MASSPNPRAESPSESSHWQFGFWSLIVTQFQNAFNDNGVKWVVIYLIVAANYSDRTRDTLMLVVGALFAVPFILFSMLGGNFADRYSKRNVVIGTKLMEIVVMGVAILGLYLHNLPVECLAVFLISAQSALFGPSKYGLLPELVPDRELSWANGIIELGTFLASILAVMAAGYMVDSFHHREYIAGLLLLGCTLFGLSTSFFITHVPAADPSKQLKLNPVGDLRIQMKTISADRVLGWAVAGNAYLFFLAAFVQFVIVVYAHDVLKVNDQRTSYIQAALAIGIGLGSLAAGYLSGGKIEVGLVPIGAVGMTIFGALLYGEGHTLKSASVLLALLGFFAGFFVVPIGALIQHRPKPIDKGGVIAAANFWSFIGIFFAAGAFYFCKSVLHQQAGTIFLDGAVLTGVMTIVAVYLIPATLVRLAMWLLTHSIYRLRTVNLENIPQHGGALLVANHMSLIDALLLLGSIDRPIRFLMFKDIYDLPYIKPFAKMIEAIPISSQLRPRDMIQSLRAASDAIRNGEIVCIFAEGQITRIGQLLPFRRGLERIMKGVDAPIIPVYLDGVWGSIFSYERGRFLWKLPRRVPYPVTVTFGKPMPNTATAFEVREAVQELQSDAFKHHRARMRTLVRSFVRTGHRYPFRFAMGDKRRPRMKWGAALLSSIFLARRLRKTWEGQEMVGILLPPSVPGALVNFAAMISAKVPVNLNYTASNETIAASAKQCNLKTVITTKLLLEKLPIEVPGRQILLEEVAAAPTVTERLVALLHWFMPGSLLERRLSAGKTRSLDDLATIIFSSGSTGEPKGVMLTHYNIASNIEQMGQTFMLQNGDVLLGVLPFFHSFGFTVTLWLPAVMGIGVAFHPSPLDLVAVSELVRDYKITFLLATPTFLQAYARRCLPEDFGSLEFVVVGAEKLPDALALAFEDRFGIRPLEGYGTTECSPVVAVNTRDYRAAGFRQIGAKRGHIGHPLPGVSIRIIDPETNERLGVDKPGLMLVRGPNVMKGYLNNPEKTAQVLKDGWYVTGDIASQDEDGFITITDRLSRFSKIGGEMVPHIKIEEKLQELSDSVEKRFVVTAVPDEKKGERLVVLHTLNPDEVPSIIEKLGATGLPNLWLPRANQYFHIDELPHLGTGKLDLRKIRELAADLSKKSPAPADSGSPASAEVPSQD
jgi:acyl-[acyl-carrier-protein]-phospholipid O-acyltransferase / long-chain-fatty-acid--[acyl-carrier-protein] ligase